MTIEIGRLLGPYRIEAPLGAGGMGEVYRARDTRLDRTVAVKILPGHLSDSPDLRQRFEREAKVVSSLSHPHICTLYDVGRDDGVDYLVMEHLEGETLAQRLERGPLPLADVLRLGIQIADALERAHAGGVVHRDLKPGNVMLVGGNAKLLDFGLAKHLAPAAPGAASSGSALLTQTSADTPLTTRGTIVGTFQYMAPEQLEGQDADARSDLFALGAVLYEMATGRRAFEGKTQASLIGSIMQSEPTPVSTLMPMTPPAFERLVTTCLAKDPERRWRTAHDVKLQLEWIAEGGSQAGVPAPVAARRRGRERLAWIAAALAALAAIGFAVAWVQRAPEPPRQVRFQIPQPADLPVVGAPKLSPDGRYLAFNATDTSGKTGIWIRAMDAIEPRPLTGTEGAGRPFWSPDSAFLGFFADGKLKKVAVAGGPPQVVCDAPSGSDGTWSEQGVILYDGRDNDPILRVSAGGGVPTPLIEATTEPGNEQQVGWPQFLPGGDKFLFVQFGAGQPEVQIADADGSHVRSILPGQSRVEYSPPGYLLYVREATLVAQPFDADDGELTGEPVPLAEGLGISNVGLSEFSASRSGALAFRAGLSGKGRLVWLDRNGKELEEVIGPDEIGSFSLSPDERWVAVTIGGDVWVRDLRRGVTSRFTLEDGPDMSPVYSPDGGRIAYSTIGNGPDVVVRAVGGAGQPQTVIDDEGGQFASDWSPDGAWLLYYDLAGTGASIDIAALSLADGEKHPFLATRFNEVRARFAPDGRWVVYQSGESGQSEIYVQAFPGPGGKWQISTRGGSDPEWSRDGRELFYVSADRDLMRVAVSAGDSFEAGVPERLFPVSLLRATADRRYVPSRDGRRFLALTPIDAQAIPPTTVVLDWTAVLAP